MVCPIETPIQSPIQVQCPQVLGRSGWSGLAWGGLLGLLLGLPVQAAPLKTTPVSSPTIAANQAATAALNSGMAAIQRGDLPGALAAFQQAVQLAPTSAIAQYNLGLAQRQSGQVQAAATSFFQAIQADRTFGLAYANLGAALLEGHNLPQAEAYLKQGLAVDPNSELLQYNYGQLLRQQGKDAEAHYTFGSILLRQGKVDDALNAFRRATEVNGAYGDAYYGAGLAFLQKKQPQEAKQLFAYALQVYQQQGNTTWAKRSADQLKTLGG
jgi:tetratricopeptide (TPR) repeat protein